MKQKLHSTEEIIRMLRQAESLLKNRVLEEVNAKKW